MTLHDYLTTQVHRDDPVGDLARDYAEGLRIGVHPPMTTVAAFRTHLELAGAPRPVLEALEMTRSELEDY